MASPVHRPNARSYVHMERKPEHRPGDIILDHFVAHLTGPDRELARERLQDLVRIMLEIAIRQLDEDIHRQDSQEAGGQGRIPPIPPSPP